MDANFSCNVSQTQALQKSGFDDIGGLLEPTRHNHRAGLDLRSGEFSQNLQDQSFNGDGRGTVIAREFRVKPIGQPGGCQAVNFGWISRNHRMPIQSVQRGGIGTDVQTSHPRLDPILMSFRGRKKADSAGAASEEAVGISLLERPFNDKRDVSLPMRMFG